MKKDISTCGGTGPVLVVDGDRPGTPLQPGMPSCPRELEICVCEEHQSRRHHILLGLLEPFGKAVNDAEHKTRA